MIVYLHGFNSSGEGSTGAQLKKVFGNELETIDYDYIDADKAFNQIDGKLQEFSKKDPDLCIVGTSLGGFWANYFAQKFVAKCVINNPTLKPSQTLQKYMGENKNFTTNQVRVLTKEDCAKYKKFEVPVKDCFRVIVLGKKDEVIRYETTLKEFTGKGQIKITDEGHRIENVENFANIIKNAINTYPV